ncbi:MAG: hypothetical protein E3J21_13795 [Anaerolineales bacterium]|nr:MAG: hypothetical protein E3J21_13795 [Anaerolineales bacterium]
MTTERPGYLAYLLRLWRANADAGTVWRASLESPHTGERHGFANLELLFAFLEEKTEGLAQCAEQAKDITMQMHSTYHHTADNECRSLINAVMNCPSIAIA